MSSNNSSNFVSSSNHQTNSDCNNTQSNRFEDNFQQISMAEISPKLWISVQKARRMDMAFVDLRQKNEMMINGSTVYVPTKKGLFMRKNEFQKLKSVLRDLIGGQQRPFEFSEVTGRMISGHRRIDGYWLFTLKTPSKESSIALSAIEIQKVVDYNIPNNVWTVFEGVTWE